jgi:hypothetical protein
MNPRLLKAEEALEGVLRASEGETMGDLMGKLLGSPDFVEAELRAAIWTLVSSGVAEVEKGRVHLAHAEAAVAA